MSSHDVTRQPGLFRIGDLGVSSEWRDISLDWSPVLTVTGVFVYSYLRDSYDQQRNLRPFLVRPQGPTKRSIQYRLGLKTPYALEGPEYLLATVGLLHVEIRRGANDDPDRPNATNVAYYAVGRLDHPVLDWLMLDRMLDTLIVALDEPVANKKAAAAVRALGQAGMLQNCDPDDYFYPFGAWPNLLATLIQDTRWQRLFAHLHGNDAVAPYRRQARAWIQATQRSVARLDDENNRIRNLVLEAQRHPSRRQRSAGDTPVSSRDTAQNNVHLPEAPAVEPETFTIEPGTPDPKAIGVTHTAFVPEMSPGTKKAIGVTHTGSGTPVDRSHFHAVNDDLSLADTMSLAGDQLINGCNEENGSSEAHPSFSGDIARDTASEAREHTYFPIADYLHDAESTSTCYDGGFWTTVNSILTGQSARYAHTDAEKKAVMRTFKRRNIPVGAVLAALRAVMTLPDTHRPSSFGAAIKLPAYHVYLQQAHALLPARLTPPSDTRGWYAFLTAYRSQGQQDALRDVSVPDYHTLKAIFDRQPDACWQVLSNIEHADQPVKLTPRYLQRAIENNVRAQVQQALLPVAQTAECHPDNSSTRVTTVPAPSEDLRVNLLAAEGVQTPIIQPGWTIALIKAWIAEADARANEIHNRPAWIMWGLRSGRMPSEYLRAQRSSSSASPIVPAGQGPAAPVVPEPASSKHADTWASVQLMLKQRIDRVDYDTWLREATLIQLDEREAVIGTPNIFAREKIEGAFRAEVEDALHAVLDRPVLVQVVIAGCP